MVSRRTFVCGLGATLASMSVLDLTRTGRTWAEPSGAPLRLVLWPSLNGAAPEYFWPNGGNLAAMSLVTQPLKDYQKQIIFLKGLDIAGSENHMAVRSIFTGAPIADYASPDPGVKSIDQLVRDQVQATAPTTLGSLHLGVRPADSIEFYKLYGRSTFFFAPSSVDYEGNPVKAFDRTFGQVTGGRPAPPAATGPSDIDLRNMLITMHADELSRLKRSLEKSPVEVARLNLHDSAIQTLVRDPAGGGPVIKPVTCDPSVLASVEKLRATLATNDAAAYQDSLFSDVFDAQVDIMARALVCGVTRVATLQAGSADGNVIVPIDAGYPHHNTSHGDSRTFARCQAWYAGKFLRLLRALDTPDPLDPEGKTTVLYNSVIVWLSECLPVDHGSKAVPCMVVGNGGGKLATGKILDVTGATNRHLNKTLARLFNVADANSGHFGQDTLSGLLS